MKNHLETADLAVILAGLVLGLIIVHVLVPDVLPKSSCLAFSLIATSVFLLCGGIWRLLTRRMRREK